MDPRRGQPGRLDRTRPHPGRGGSTGALQARATALVGRVRPQVPEGRVHRPMVARRKADAHVHELGATGASGRVARRRRRGGELAAGLLPSAAPLPLLRLPMLPLLRLVRPRLVCALLVRPRLLGFDYRRAPFEFRPGRRRREWGQRSQWMHLEPLVHLCLPLLLLLARRRRRRRRHFWWRGRRSWRRRDVLVLKPGHCIESPLACFRWSELILPLLIRALDDAPEIWEIGEEFSHIEWWRGRFGRTGWRRWRIDLRVDWWHASLDALEDVISTHVSRNRVTRGAERHRRAAAAIAAAAIAAIAAARFATGSFKHRFP